MRCERNATQKTDGKDADAGPEYGPLRTTLEESQTAEVGSTVTLTLTVFRYEEHNMWKQ